MRAFVKPLLWTLTALVGFTTSGCLSRQMLGFQTHPTEQTVLMETFDTRNYLVWQKHEHVYWSCSEADNALQCVRRCGGKSDLVCPTFSIFANSGGTNVR